MAKKASSSNHPKKAASAAAKKGTKSKKPAEASPSPKSLLDKIVASIRAQPAGNNGGVSRIGITKYLQSEFDYHNNSQIKLALQRGVSSGVLIQLGQSFAVKGDPVKISAVSNGGSLHIEDIVLGKEGDLLSKPGDSITVSYVGTLDDGKQFDAAKSFNFVLGAGDVIKGWDQGLVGMAVGAKRRLVVPSSLGYGKRGCAPDIPPNATLHFTVTMKKIVSDQK